MPESTRESTRVLFDVRAEVSSTGDALVAIPSKPTKVKRYSATLDLGKAQVEGEFSGAMTLNGLGIALGLSAGDLLRVRVEKVEAAEAAEVSAVREKPTPEAAKPASASATASAGAKGAKA